MDKVNNGDHVDHVDEVQLVSAVTLTPQRSTQKQLDASPFATDSILSEIDRGT